MAAPKTSKTAAKAAPVKPAVKAGKKRAIDEVEAAPEKKGKKAAPAVVEPEAEDDDDEEDDDFVGLPSDAEEDDEEDSDVEAFMDGFDDSSEGEDSSADEGEDEAAPSKKKSVSFSTSALPEPPKSVKGKGKAAEPTTVAEGKKDKKAPAPKESKKPVPGTIYLGRIPHGFYEDEMKDYFGQFGDVTRLRLSRNKTTGRSKHYAFIEFKHASVAQIVQETMDNYLLLGHILVCKLIPKDKVHPRLWVGANRKFRAIPAGRRERIAHNAPKTEDQQKKISSRLLKREAEKRAKLAKSGIDYDFAGYEGKEVAAEKEKAPEPAKKKAKVAPAAAPAPVKEKKDDPAEVKKKVKAAVAAAAAAEAPKKAPAAAPAAAKKEKAAAAPAKKAAKAGAKVEAPKQQKKKAGKKA